MLPNLEDLETARAKELRISLKMINLRLGNVQKKRVTFIEF